jgi:hypothetical protein
MVVILTKLYWLEYYGHHGNLQVEDLKMKLEELYADNPNVTRGVVRTSSILKSLHLFLLTGKAH